MSSFNPRKMDQNNYFYGGIKNAVAQDKVVVPVCVFVVVNDDDVCL